MRIRERVGERRARNRWLVPVGAAAAAALVAGGVAGGLALAGDDDPQVAPPAVSPSSTASPTPSSQPASQTVTVPVYYLGDTGRSLRLYREFHRATSNKPVIETAVHEMLAVPAMDADYKSVWPTKTSVNAVSVSRDVATVDFSSQVTGPFNGGTEAATISVQQLVWTVTAADPKVKSVDITVDGKPITDLWGVDVSKPQKRGIHYEVLGAVWILTPTERASVKSPVVISGQATVFEATVSIEIRRAGIKVKDTFVTASEGGPARGNWTLSVPLPPGTYEVRAYESSAEDGSVLNLDDKTFTVR